jgi:hypothetical protein
VVVLLTAKQISLDFVLNPLFYFRLTPVDSRVRSINVRSIHLATLRTHNLTDIREKRLTEYADYKFDRDCA